MAIVRADRTSRDNLAAIVARRHTVAWVASTEPETMEHCLRQPPDLILVDVGEPHPEAVRLAGKLVEELEHDVLLLTSGDEARGTLEALASGALDVLALPSSSAMDEQFLLDRLDQIFQVLQPRRPGRRMQAPFPLVCVGASTGGPEALAQLLSALPEHFSAGIVLLQHVSPPFVAGLARYLSTRCALPVLLTQNGVMPRPGEVLLAGRGGRHLGMSPTGRLVRADLVDGPRPSIDHFMECVARYWPGPVLGVLLSGLGGDGARGLLALRERGHATVVQDEASSTVFGMPKAAIELGAAGKVLSLSEIAREILELQ